MLNFKNKNVVITGASGDIGQSLVKTFANYQANIFMMYEAHNFLIKSLNFRNTIYLGLKQIY